MLQAYYLMPEDNDSIMFESNEFNKCSNCGLKIDTVLNLEMDLNMTKYDFSVTYDGYTIVSSGFKEFCEKEKIKNLTFIPLKLNNDFWLFDTKNIVEFDKEKRDTQFINLCFQCNQYQEIIGANPVALKNDEKINEGIFKTDLEFGQKNSKSSLFIAGIETAKKMKEMKFMGIYYEEVRYLEKLIKVKKTTRSWFNRFNSNK